MSTAAASVDPAPAVKPRRQRRQKSVPASSTSSEQPMLPLDVSADPPSPAEPTPPAPAKQRVYVARKKITIDGQIRKPGDVVPEADSLPRVESWVRSGYLNEVWR